MGRKRRTSPESPKREQPRKERSSARKTRPGGSGPARPRGSDRLPTQNPSATGEELAALPERVERFRHLCECAPLGYQSLDAEGRLLDVNSTWLELLGYQRDEVLGRSFGDFMTPTSRAAFRERFPEFLAAGEIRGAERELVRKDGTVVTVSIDGRVERDHHPSPRTHCLLRDVTDQRRAGEALRQREAAYRRLVENISDALIVDDREGRIVYANDRFLELFGFTRAELSSIRLEDYVAPRDCARLRDYHERRVRGESVPERYEYEGLRRDGTALWLEVRVTPVEEGGRIVGTQSLIRDVTASKDAAAALRESEQKYRTLLELAQEGIWSIDDQARTTFVNPRLAEMLGYTLDEMQGRSLYDFMDPAHVAAAQENFRRRKAGIAERHEFEFRRKDGTPVLTELSTAPMKDAAGRFVGAVALVMDITERRQVEQKLRLLAEFLDLAPGAITVHDIKGRFLYANRRTLEMHGYTEAEFLALPLSKLDVPESAALIDQRMRQAAESGEARFEVMHFRKDGTTFPLEIFAKQVDWAGAPVILSIGLDITERRQAEAAQRRLVAAIEQAGEIIVITDTAGTIQYVNAAFEQVTGYRRAEAVGRNPRILKSGRHDAAFYRTLWQTITAGDVWRGRFVNRRKDGTLYDEEAVLAPVRDARGQITNFVAVKRDITEELSLAEQLRQAQKMEAIGQLAAGVAHDFNNLLTALLGYVGLARQTAAPDAATSEALDGIENLAVTAAGITKSLLMFSGRSQATLEPVNLGTLLAESAKLLQHVVPRAVTLRITAPADEPLWVRGDRTQLQQVIMNLALNARDAMPDGGELSICVTPLADDEALTDGAAPVAQPAVCLCVGDTGCGMSPKTQARIFEPFFTTKPRGRGTGLGLPIVFGIVKEHGGHVDVRSAPGQGSTFRVILPRVPAPAGAPPPSPTAAEPRGRGELILLAEEDPYVRALLVTELERLGYTAAAAADGEELLRLYEERRPAVRLLVLDFDLPRQTGGQCLRQIRRGGDRVPAILISGAAEARRRVGDLEARRLNKPFTLPQFAEAVYLALASTPQSEVVP